MERDSQLQEAFLAIQRVIISDALTNLLDWTTFELTEIAFGDRFITVPPHTQHFEKTEKLRQNGYDFDVQIEAGIRLDTGEVYARFQSLNPTNGLPPPVEIGMLPPEDGTGRGQGHIGYAVRPRTGLATVTEIRNVAWITFDQNPAIGTDWVDPHDPSKGIDPERQALVTIDADPPSSAVAALPAEAFSAEFEVNWSGSDAGSGIASYDIYVSTNGGPWTLWLTDATGSSAILQGRTSESYAFYSVARDHTGQAELPPVGADAFTTTPANNAPELAPIPDVVMRVNETLVITNTATDLDLAAQELTFDIESGSTLRAVIDPKTGVFRWTPFCAQGSTTNEMVVGVTDNGSPARSAFQSFTVTVLECVEASLGETIVLLGERSSVPVRLLSTVELTNLTFSVLYPPERFSDFALVVSTPEVSEPLLESPAPGRLDIHLTLPAEWVLHGPTNVGELQFLASASQSSAFVPLPITDIGGLKPNGRPVANAYGQAGRIVVAGEEPLLEAFLTTNQQVALILYGIPGTTNQIVSAAVLPWTGSWTNETEVVLTNLFQLIPIEGATNRSMFFQAIRP